MRLVKVTNKTRGTTVGERVELANTSLTRLRGLLGRRALGAGEGLWIKPSSGVHTVGMKFSIDVVGLDSRMRVIKLWREMAPFRVTSVSLRVCSVIELAAGRINECAIELGDVMDIAIPVNRTHEEPIVQ